ncbi:MAG: hypothetical protein NTW78_09225 [Campylobacterales bacterium]|nr:hypothetical protein [Campylobacterales bacterium]
MKFFFTSLAFMLLLSACADKTAFSRFEMNKEQELAASSLQSSKIVSEEGVDGVFSAIYLNAIYPDIANKYETFYISLYLKKNKENFVIKLNGKMPLEMEKLSHVNKFSHLASTENEWNSYYLVSFEKGSQDSKQLSLVLESGQSSSVALIYQKD